VIFFAEFRSETQTAVQHRPSVVVVIFVGYQSRLKLFINAGVDHYLEDINVCAVDGPAVMIKPDSKNKFKIYQEACSRLSPDLAFFNKPCFFMYIMSCDIAAGVTPEILEARARVSGLALASFCLTSLERPSTLVKSRSAGMSVFS